MNVSKLVLSSRPLTMFVLATSLMVAGCSSVRDELGLSKVGPDEFTVVTKAPLVVPPDFSLRPPAPGQKRLRDIKPRESAKTAIFGESTANPNLSNGESKLLTKAGANAVDPAIREIIDQETADLVTKNQTVGEQIMFWKDAVDPSAIMVDPLAESQRIQQNQATGAPITEGATPTTDQKVTVEGDDGWFDFGKLLDW